MIDISPAPSRRSLGLRVGNAALTVAAALGAVSLVTALVFTVASVTPLVLTSGSMDPEIPTGSLALARSVPVDEVAVGDVVSVWDARGTRVTHRVVALDPAGLVLQGDANPTPDADPYDVPTADRVLVAVPHAGTVLAALTAPVGRGVLLAIAAVVLLTWVRPRGRARPARSEGVAVLGVLAVVAGVGVGVARAPEGTTAFWSDTVAGTGQISVATAAPVPERPVLTGCNRQGSGAALTWTSSSNPTSFQVRHQNPTSEAPVAGTARTAATVNANLNNSVGEIWVVAITGGLESESNHFRYSGNGSGASCVPVG
ncbi:signal peptidase I [Nocardioides sp. P5_C9_2]